MYDLIFSKIADFDIDQNYTYIMETLEAPKSAENLFDELYKKINDILENPYKKSLVHDKYLASLGIRSIKVKNYVLFYNITEENNTVNVLRFMYKKRDWVNLLKEKPVDVIHA